jgi:hypothetical protein
MRKYPLICAAFFVVLAFSACNKDNNTATTTLKINLTDGPGDYQQVNVQVLEVLVKMADDSSQWLSLATNAGIYNLLDFQNGVDTLIASGPVPLDVLQEVRLVLGPDNTVLVDSVLYDLETPSAEQSGLKIKVDKNLAIALDSLTLDFDAEKSVVKTGNGKYMLKPVILVKN